MARQHFPDSHATSCDRNTGSSQWNETEVLKANSKPGHQKPLYVFFHALVPIELTVLVTSRGTLKAAVEHDKISVSLCSRSLHKAGYSTTTHLPPLIEKEHFCYVEPFHIWVYLLPKRCLP